MPSAAKPQKGGILTVTGCEKLEQAIQQANESQNFPPSYGKIAQQAGIPVEVAIQILYRQGKSDLKAIQSLYKAFGVRLQRQDYEVIRTEEEVGRVEPPADCILSPGYEGREGWLERLKVELESNPPVRALTGISGVGKTTLLRHGVQEVGEGFERVVWLDGDRIRFPFPTLLRQVLGEEIALKLPTPAEQIHPLLMALETTPQLVILDGVEAWLNPEQDAFQDPGLQPLLEALLTQTQCPSRVILVSSSPLPISLPQWELDGLDEGALSRLFQAWGIALDDEASQNSLRDMMRVYDGHPLTLKILAGEIRSAPYYGNLRAYWHDYGYDYELALSETPETTDPYPPLIRALERVLQRLGRLAPLAYELLGLGAMNPKGADLRGWQFLIGDFPLSEQEAAILSLKQRFLLEAEINDPQVRYSLHKFLRHVVGLTIPDLKQKGV
ncbi:ATP-binding protein [Spirulina subsalsa]|uniref:ATP-binding protein n=1 Tax=Spirulina subsalsa TaxID=54311 RepID=UPI0002EE9A33|nr:ATP-binding protein [Spirulina subsalsa]